MVRSLARTEGGTQVTIQAQPRARRTEVVGFHGDAIRLRVAAPPVDGAANDEIVRFLALRLGLPKREITVASGHSGRRKVIEVGGLAPEIVALRLGLTEGASSAEE